MRKAIIDLGTNTFNLLISDVEGDRVRILYRTKQPAKLGEGSINDNIISEKAIGRAIRILKEYKATIDQYQVDRIQAIATSAVRSARNQEDFVNRVKEEADISINVISGLEEANWIFKGVSKAFKKERSFVILDIGGGSTEFIFVKDGAVVELKSFDLGMARLMEKFKPSNPMSNSEIKQVSDYLETHLHHFLNGLKMQGVKTLVGSSGSFDTVLSMVAHRFFTPKAFAKNLSTEIACEHFNIIYEMLIQSTLEERKEMPGMSPIRVEMMALSVVFIKFVKEYLGIDTLVQSEYSLKEGILFSE